MKDISLKKASFINAIAKYAVIIMNIFFTAILARILTPEDYGIIAIVTIFTTLFARFCDMGFGSAIIQYRDLDKEAINQIFTFTAIIAVIVGILFAFLGIPVAAFYNQPIYTKICAILSVSVFFNCLNMVPNAVLLRDKEFFKVAVRTIVVNVVGYAVAICCAVWGGKYYALVWQSVIAAVLDFLWNNYTAKLQIKLKMSLKPVKRVFNYSFFQFIFGWVNYVESNLDNILIGGIMGSTALAYYDKAYKLICYPMNNIAGVVTPVLHPILKDYQEDKETLFQKYVEVQRILSCIAIAIVPIFFIAGPEIITIIYGNQWKVSILPFVILSIAIYPKIMMATTGAIYCSAGSTKMLFVAGTLNAIVTGGAIIAGILGKSVITVAVSVAIANWSNMLVTFFILIHKVLEQNVFLYYKKTITDILVMIMECIVMSVLFKYFQIENMLVSFFIKCLVSFFIYALYLLISRKYKIIIKLLKR